MVAVNESMPAAAVAAAAVAAGAGAAGAVAPREGGIEADVWTPFPRPCRPKPDV